MKFNLFSMAVSGQVSKELLLHSTLKITMMLLAHLKGHIGPSVSGEKVSVTKIITSPTGLFIYTYYAKVSQKISSVSKSIWAPCEWKK